jgi:hypothetical protein
MPLLSSGSLLEANPNDPTTLKAPVPNYLNQISEDIHGLRIGVDHAFATEGVGMQLGVPPLSEQRLLQAVHTFQKLTDGHARHPNYSPKQKN